MSRRRKSKKQKIVAVAIIAFAMLLFMAGLYLLPIGTDAFLYFFVEVIAHGNWVLGDIYANITALAMIIVGFVLLRMEGVKPGLKKTKKKKGGK